MSSPSKFPLKKLLAYQENEAYHFANDIEHKCFNSETFELLDASYNVECFNSGGIWLKTETFDNFSNPSSNLNDNTKSISNSVGALAHYLSRIITNPSYNKMRRRIWKIVGKSPFFKNKAKNGL